MKKIIFAGAFCALALAANAQTKFIADLEVPLSDPASKKVVGKAFEGSPVEVVGSEGEFAIIELKGEPSELDAKTLALKKTPILTLARFDAGAQKQGRYLVKADLLTSDAAEAWEEVETLYYDTCSSRHAAHKPKEHEMGEWEALLLAIQTFAKITDEEKDRLLRYVQAYAKDGIIK